MEEIVNKVAASGIVTLDLSAYLPASQNCLLFDLKPFLFMEMIIKEKDFRTALLAHDWPVYQDKHVAIICSADAIIPMWAYMLVSNYLSPVARSVYFGPVEEMRKHLLVQTIEATNKEVYRDKRVVLKGCGDVSIPEAAYIAATQHLRPVVKSLMYGEPCSTVPVYKAK